MKNLLKQTLGRLGLRLLREPAGVVMGHDLWRDIGILLGPAPLCIDAGANHGDVSAALRELRPAARVHAFDPSPTCQAALRTRFAGQTGVVLVPSGLGDEEGVREFHRYANSHLGSFLTLEAQAGNPFQGEPEVARDQVPITTVDRYAADQAVETIDLLKIDTQGFDLRVLKGARRLFQRGAVKHVLIELNFIPLYKDQPAPEEIVAFLRGHGLQLVDCYEKCRREQRLAWCTALFRHFPG